jgi:hypothetical protein
MSKIFFKILTLYFFVGIYSCCKEKIKPTELPAITSSGERTFACLVNGEVFIHNICPNNNSIYLRPEYDSTYNWFRLKAANEFHFENPLYIDLSIRNCDGVEGIVPMSNDYHDRPINNWSLNTLKSNYIEFTRFDTAEKIVSGTFQFTCFDSSDSTNILEITDGRFDLALYFD